MYMETHCPQCGWLLWKNHLGDVLYCHCGWVWRTTSNEPNAPLPIPFKQ